MADIVEGYRNELEARGFSNLRYIGNGRVVSVRREDDHEAIEEVEEREDNDENPAHKSRLILERIIARPPYRNDNDEISAKCCVCLENQIAYTFAPCNHFMICQACLVQLLAEADSNLSPGLKCPVCRVFTKKNTSRIIYPIIIIVMASIAIFKKINKNFHNLKMYY
ncbi:uncharacterized protein LOC141536077 [Cotesia typhae]|uniref:uncharacterized protein LOC141536077 n=1 Tax=Cotesia typhae TaxID=2053667 RepID=UPI003D69F02E